MSPRRSIRGLTRWRPEGIPTSTSTRVARKMSSLSLSLSLRAWFLRFFFLGSSSPGFGRWAARDGHDGMGWDGRTRRRGEGGEGWWSSSREEEKTIATTFMQQVRGRDGMRGMDSWKVGCRVEAEGASSTPAIIKHTFFPHRPVLIAPPPPTERLPHLAFYCARKNPDFLSHCPSLSAQQLEEGTLSSSRKLFAREREGGGISLNPPPPPFPPFFQFP